MTLLIIQLNFKDMKLQCQDFYFYPNGTYSRERKYDNNTHTYFSDVQEGSRAIRIFGTLEQIDKALDDYVERTGLNLDECYNYDTPSKLRQYQELYLERNNHARKFKAIIINIV